MIYPYFSVNGFPEIWSSEFIQLIFLESVFGCEIIIKFFLQKIDEKGQSLTEPLETVATNYFRSQFLIDLIVLLPLGGIFSLIDYRWKLLWLIKAYRIKELQYYMSPRFFKPFINYYIDQKQNQALLDPVRKFETSFDQTYMTQKIYGRNIIQIVRLIIQLFVIVYFVGMYWFVFVDVLMHIILISRPEDPFDDDVELNNFQKEFRLIELKGFGKTLAAMYFAMTSLSTIGFGDMYPVNDLERLLGSFMLLSGVAVFSMVMGQLSFMVANMDILNGDQEDDDQLE